MGIKASAQYTIAEIHEECNVVISNESHVFRADKNNTAVAGNTSIQIYGYQGSTQIATTVGTISGLPSTGMTATISNNGKTNTSITVTVTTDLTSSVANNGVLTIPITVAGKTFNKTFSWSKAQTGATGATGGTGATARTYWVTSSANTVTRSMKGTLTPATITFSSYYRDGTSATSTAYAGRFIIQESSNGTSWTTKYTSSANESSKAYTPTATTNLVRCAMYAAGGTTNKLDELTIGVVDSIDDLAIGSRNFILNSDRVLENTATAVGQSIGIAPPSQVSDDMVSCIKKGDTLDYSIEIKVDGDLTFGTTNPYIGLEVAYQYTKTDGTTANAYLSVAAVRTELNDETKYPKGKWVRIHKINTMAYDPIKWHQPTWLIRDTTGQISTRRPQVCLANKETGWTPASEDQIDYTDDVVKRANDSLKDYIDEQNALISGEVTRVDESIGERITENNQNIINQVSSSVKEEFDKTTGEKIRDLEKYTSHFKVTGNALTYNIDKTKGTNLIKNSVMLQNKTNANKKTKANFWLNKALQEDYFTHVTSNDADSVRAKTTSGSAIVLDYTVDSTNLTYDYILSAPIDFKLDTDNIMLSYKIKGAVSAGHFFIGLVFYKKDSTVTGLGASAAFTQSTGIPTAHYLALKEYTTGKEFTDFTKDYILKTTPFVKSDKKIVNYSCEVSASNTITLPFAPYLINGTCTVTVYDLNGEEIKINTTGTTVNLGDGDWPAMVAVQYERALSNFSGTTASSITASNFSTVLDNEVLMYYNTSDKKIWVYNPFTGTYVKSANLYNGTDYSEVDSVRVILGVRGASTSAKFSGHIEVSDLKVEYDSLSQIWTQHPGETYSKLYQMDEKGFSISSDTNMMFIDEDEIAAYTLDAEGKPETDNPVFQISGEKTILKKTVIREDLLIENSTATEQSAFIMKQYNVGNQWYFLFY